MAAKLIVAQAMDPNGTIQSGAKLDIYDAGTTTRRAIYTTSALSTQSTNPAVATSDGAIAVWIDDTAGDYKATLTNSAQTTTYFNVDNIDPAQGNLLIYPLGGDGGGGSGGSGDVSSVNGQTGVVVLDPDDFDDTSTAHKFISAAELSKLAGIEAGADVTGAANVISALSSVSVGAHSDVDMTGITNGQALVYNSTTQTLEPGTIGGGGVSSVNSQTGAVVLDADDIDDTSTAHKFATAEQLAKIDGVESGADVTDATSVTSALAIVSVGAHSDVDLAGITNGQGLVYNASIQTFEPGAVGGGGSGDLLAANNLSDLDNAATARTNLGLQIGADVMAYDANLQSFVTTFTLPTTDGTANQVLKTDGAGALSFVDQASGSGDLLAANNLSDLDNAATARTNLGLQIGSDVLAYDANLQGFLDALTLPTADGSSGQVLKTDGAGAISWQDDASGGVDFGTKVVFVVSAGAGNDSLAAIHAARDAVGVGGTIVLAPGSDYEITGSVNLNVANQRLVFGAGSSLTARDTGSRFGAINITAANVTIAGQGEIDCTLVNNGINVRSTALGVQIIPDDLFIKDCYNRGVDIKDAWSDDATAIVSGLRFRWSSASISKILADQVLVLPINLFGEIAVDVRRLIVRDNEVDFSNWTVSQVSQTVLAPLGVRVNQSGTGEIRDFEVCHNRVLMPQATDTSDWTASGRITGIEVKSTNVARVSRGSVHHNTVIGGDIGLNCSFISRDVTVSENTCVGQTAYCIESVACDVTIILNNRCDGRQAHHPISCANSSIVKANGNVIHGPREQNSNPDASAIWLTGVDEADCRNNWIITTEDSTPCQKIQGGNTVDFSGSYFKNTGTASNAVEITTTNGNVIFSGARFADASGDSIRVASGSVACLVTLGCTGVSTGGYTNNGTVTNHIDAYNFGISGLAGSTSSGSGDLLAANNLSDLDSIATARANLGLGSIATQSSGSVNITGGSITGITDLAIAHGGTGASTASSARSNLGLGSIATQSAGSVSITGGSLNGTAIGAATPSTASFTTLLASGNVTFGTDLFRARGSIGGGVVAVGAFPDANGGKVQSSGPFEFRGNDDDWLIVSNRTNFTRKTGLKIVGQPNPDLVMAVNDQEVLRAQITTNNVGIGEASPNYKLDVNGAIGFTPGASVTPVDNGDVCFELTNNTTLTVKAKGSDGTIRSATLALT